MSLPLPHPRWHPRPHRCAQGRGLCAYGGLHTGGGAEWTSWFNIDHPGGDGDYESLDAIRFYYRGRVCARPVAIQARTTEWELPQDVGEVVHFSPKKGFRCVNKEQPQGKTCSNYHIRFLCPLGECRPRPRRHLVGGVRAHRPRTAPTRGRNAAGESVPGRGVPMNLPPSVTPSAPPRAHLLVSLVLLEPLLAERLREQRDPEPPAPLRQRAGGDRAEGAQMQGQGGGTAAVQHRALPRYGHPPLPTHGSDPTPTAPPAASCS